MLRQDVQAAVDHGSESESVEYKSAFDSNSPADWAEIIKDLVALANSCGGAIIFGRAHSDRARARPGQSRHRYLDRSRRRGGWLPFPARQPQRPDARRCAVREGRVADALSHTPWPPEPLALRPTTPAAPVRDSAEKPEPIFEWFGLGLFSV